MTRDILILLIISTALLISIYIIVGSVKGLNKIKKIEREIKDGEYL